MSSSDSSGVSWGCRGRGDKGIPRKCRCGANSTIQTSKTVKNPGRLFYCCPFGEEEGMRHLFKWTDISMVEEIEEVENVVEKIQVDVQVCRNVYIMLNLEMETRSCEAVASSYGEKIEEIKESIQVCEKEIGELKAVVSCYEKEIEGLRCFKNMVVCGLIMVFGYYFIFT